MMFFKKSFRIWSAKYPRLLCAHQDGCLWYTPRSLFSTIERMKDYLGLNRKKHLEGFLDKYTSVIEVSVPCLNQENTFITYRLRVLDTYPDDTDQKRLTVVCLQGLTTVDGVGWLLSQFFDQGVRVITANFTGTEQLVLHSNQDPTVDFSQDAMLLRVEAILEQKKIDRVDLLVSNGCAVWQLLMAGAVWSNVHALAVIEPDVLRPQQYIHPHKRFRRTLSSIGYLILGFLRCPFGVLQNKIRDSLTLPDAVKNATLDFYMSMLSCSLKNQRHAANSIREKRLPIVVFYSEENKIADTIFHECLGIPKETNVVKIPIIQRDDTQELPNVFMKDGGWYARCCVFESAGPSLKISWTTVLRKELEDLLIRVRDVDFPDLEDINDNQENQDDVDKKNNQHILNKKERGMDESESKEKVNTESQSNERLPRKKYDPTDCDKKCGKDCLKKKDTIYDIK